MEIMTRTEKLELLERATAQLAAAGNRPIHLRLNVAIAAGLISQLQLAFRHPENVSESRNSVEKLTRNLIDLLDPGKGDVHRFLMMGFDRQYDEPCEPEAEKLDWEKAINHFREVRGHYQDLVGTAGVNTSIALEYLFKPVAARYYGGERTRELFDLMMKVE